MSGQALLFCVLLMKANYRPIRVRGQMPAMILVNNLKNRRGDMYIPTQFLPINVNRPKPTKRGEVTFEKSESNPDSAKPSLNSHVILFEKREGQDRRKRKTKPLLDTRLGRDRRYDKENPSIDTKA
ncbi:MAG: hypothetical protein ACJA0G_001715 [Kangiellaceae bacterium]|jgi:hypothetical protein